MISTKRSQKARKKRSISLILAIILIIASFFCGFFINNLFNGKDKKALSEIVFYLKEYGVFDTKTLELKNFSEEDIARIITENSSDDYATYYTPEEYKKTKANGKGDYQGIGVNLTDDLIIKKVIINSPAFHAGLRENDKIKSITYGEKTISLNTLSDLREFLSKRSESDTFVLSFIRNGEILHANTSAKSFNATYVCYKDSDGEMYFLTGEDGKIKPTFNQVANDIFPSDVAYIALSSFEGDAGSEIERALSFMKDRGRTKLVFDLRDNGGGYMSVLSKVASSFIYNGGKSSSAIVYEKDNDGDFAVTSTNSNKFPEHITAISVIANENTASASECLIGAMLYYKDKFSIDSLIIENEKDSENYHTFGKGIMQTTYPLSNGGGIKLTTAVIYQPDKTTCIHNTGIIAKKENSCLKSNGIALTKAISVLG